MKQITVILFVFLSLSSCREMVLGEEEENTPTNNFEILWQDFDQHYGLFAARNLKWDSIYSAYQPQISTQTTEEELWKYFKEMVEYLDDGHTFIYAPKQDWFWESGSTLNEIAFEEFSSALVEEKYLENVTRLSTESNFNYAKLKGKDIGYIHIDAMANDLLGPEVIDEVIDALGSHQAMIIDIRNNQGGDDQYSERVAGAFADGEHFIYTVQERNGVEHDDFAEKKLYHTHPAGDQQYLKPVIVLTDRATVSAAEIFLLHMNSFAHVVQIGDTTAGDFSDTGMLRFLPNGWVYQYSIMMFLLPDGTSLDGIGHIPDVYVKNTKADIENGDDQVMDKAIQYLFDNYGIQ